MTTDDLERRPHTVMTAVYSPWYSPSPRQLPGRFEEFRMAGAIQIGDVKTAPSNFCFPTANQTRHCFTRYIEFHKCLSAKGDSGECEKFAWYYRSLCPGKWIARWNERRENGTFPGPL